MEAGKSCMARRDGQFSAAGKARTGHALEAEDSPTGRGGTDWVTGHGEVQGFMQGRVCFPTLTSTSWCAYPLHCAACGLLLRGLLQLLLTLSCRCCCCRTLQTDPLRKFYTSLLQQRPDSEMAKKWWVHTARQPLQRLELHACVPVPAPLAGRSAAHAVAAAAGANAGPAVCVAPAAALPRCLQCGLLEQDEAERVLRDLGK